MQLLASAAKPVQIELENFRSPGVGVMSGREFGKEVRRSVRLDEIDLSSGEVEVRIPDDVYLLASSFFLGMFGPSVRTLGREGFRAKYKFTGEGLNPAILEDGILEALKEGSPLPQPEASAGFWSRFRGRSED